MYTVQWICLVYFCLPPQNILGHEKKKSKGKKLPCSPSRVLHIRQIPNDVTGAEVVSLGLPFGKVTNLLMLRGKGQVCSFQCFYNKSKTEDVVHVMIILILTLSEMIAMKCLNISLIVEDFHIFKCERIF